MAVGKVGIRPLQQEKQMRHREETRDLRDEQVELGGKGYTKNQRGNNDSKASYNRANGEAGATGSAG